MRRTDANITADVCISLCSLSLQTSEPALFICPAIVFEQSQRFPSPYRGGRCQMQLNMAEVPLSLSRPFITKTPSDILLVSGQSVLRFIHSHINKHICDSHYDNAIRIEINPLFH